MQWPIILGIAVSVIICIAIAAAIRRKKRPYDKDEAEILQAGKRGEAAATDQIRKVLQPGDVLLTNVELKYEKMRTELDTVIINTCGVFIVEVKNYNGVLQGGEDDFEWTKIKTTPGGQQFEKTVKNPLKQVKRQTYILAKYLEQHGARAWVTGFALLLQGNSPVTSEHMLTSLSDLERKIHTPAKTKITPQTVSKIRSLLK